MNSARPSRRRWWIQTLESLFARPNKKPYRHRPQAEELEGRLAPAIFSVGTEAELRSAVMTANTNADALNTINLTADILLSTNNSAGQENDSAEGDLDFDNQHVGVTAKQYVVDGAGFTINANAIDRIAQVIGSDVTIQFVNIHLIGGSAIDSGTASALAGDEDSLGGGVLNEGGTVSFTTAEVRGNTALGFAGDNGTDGTGTTSGAGNPGIGGATGRNARGGGLYSTSGTITITASTFTQNHAFGGDGGNGGDGAASGTPGGNGGDGGDGGDGEGGAIYLAAGDLTVAGSSVTSSSAVGGAGGSGGLGGGPGGDGGNGGAGGSAAGGGIWAANGNVTVDHSSAVNSNSPPRATVATAATRASPAVRAAARKWWRREWWRVSGSRLVT